MVFRALAFIFLWGTSFPSHAVDSCNQTTVEYNTPGARTFYPPRGVQKITLKIWAAGGGGGGGSHFCHARGGDGGAGGDYVELDVNLKNLSTPCTLTVGVGGAGGRRESCTGSSRPSQCNGGCWAHRGADGGETNLFCDGQKVFGVPGGRKGDSGGNNAIPGRAGVTLELSPHVTVVEHHIGFNATAGQTGGVRLGGDGGNALDTGTGNGASSAWPKPAGRTGVVGTGKAGGGGGGGSGNNDPGPCLGTSRCDGGRGGDAWVIVSYPTLGCGG